MSDEINGLLVQRKILSDLLYGFTKLQTTRAAAMCAITLDQHIGVNYARALGELEATKLFVYDVTMRLQAIDAQLEKLKPST